MHTANKTLFQRVSYSFVRLLMQLMVTLNGRSTMSIYLYVCMYVCIYKMQCILRYENDIYQYVVVWVHFSFFLCPMLYSNNILYMHLTDVDLTIQLNSSEFRRKQSIKDDSTLRHICGVRGYCRCPHRFANGHNQPIEIALIIVCSLFISSLVSIVIVIVIIIWLTFI